MKPKEIKRLSAVLKAISDPTRRSIFDLVLKSEKKESISTVSKEFKITRQGITKHLKMLANAGLIELKRIGRVTYCTADEEPLVMAQNWISHYLSTSKNGIKIPVLSAEEMSKVEELVSNTEKMLANIEAKEDAEKKEAAAKAQLIQMSIDPDYPGKPVEAELVKPEPTVKQAKANPIEVTDNQLDIYGIRKEPKVNEDQQLEMF
ncbi:MAG: helix-turn-helix domain-containing protein [Flavobacteriales bacterium]|jgi:DNA-binding transcriptional ArsR family regulator|tara:strand:- start:2780 stop:3394 length:615 start_codon:yes stop_codon:yes gene_type:complete